MRLSSLLAAAATLSMIALPAMAAPPVQVNPAAALSLTGGEVRAGAPMRHANKMAQATIFLLVGLGVAGVVGAAVGLSHHDSKAASA